MDADNSVHEQNHTSFNPKTDQIGLKSSTSVNKAKTPFEKHTKTFLPLREEGKKNPCRLCFLKQSVKQIIDKKCNKVKTYTISQ